MLIEFGILFIILGSFFPYLSNFDEFLSYSALIVFQYTNTDISICIWNMAWHLSMNFKLKTKNQILCVNIDGMMVIGFWLVLMFDPHSLFFHTFSFSPYNVV